MDFSGKIALITGACSGIGAATAVLLSNLGSRLALVGMNADDLAATAKKCEEANGCRPLEIVTNLTCEEEVKRTIKETLAEYNKLDVLVNCAGILEVGDILHTSLKQYDRVLDVNTRSIYHLTLLAVPHLIETKGNIVNVSSVNGLRSFPKVLAYCMSKSALDQFTRCIALELADKQVRVNSVNPGVIITNIHRAAGMCNEEYKQFLERCKTTHALGRAGKVEEVANTIAFLASDLSSFITGVNIPVDSGRHAMCPR